MDYSLQSEYGSNKLRTAMYANTTSVDTSGSTIRNKGEETQKMADKGSAGAVSWA